nr:hypothetical protein [Campylobacter jejuni]
MLPFLDEIIGEIGIDLNKYDFAYDEEGRIIWALYMILKKEIKRSKRLILL